MGDRRGIVRTVNLGTKGHPRTLGLEYLRSWKPPQAIAIELHLGTLCLILCECLCGWSPVWLSFWFRSTSVNHQRRVCPWAHDPLAIELSPTEVVRHNCSVTFTAVSHTDPIVCNTGGPPYLFRARWKTSFGVENFTLIWISSAYFLTLQSAHARPWCLGALRISFPDSEVRLVFGHATSAVHVFRKLLNGTGMVLGGEGVSMF
ncbi:hypothetical protein BSKO_10107 [Bryopsis sp. KO-2023]|nr:hypothetical protein BSKO_10107 [Bryopsis sp. KO-2023]